MKMTTLRRIKVGDTFYLDPHRTTKYTKTGYRSALNEKNNIVVDLKPSLPIWIIEGMWYVK